MEDSPLTFPCAHPLKLMGNNAPEFRVAMETVIREQMGDGQPTTVTTKTSSNGKFISLTCTVDATSRDQLDQLYRALHATGLVLMAL